MTLSLQSGAIYPLCPSHDVQVQECNVQMSTMSHMTVQVFTLQRGKKKKHGIREQMASLGLLDKNTFSVKENIYNKKNIYIIFPAI